MKAKMYRKKPVTIEAIKFDGKNGLEILDWIFQSDSAKRIGLEQLSKNETLTIETLEGNMTASKGDYIIKGVKGEFYPCKPDIFEQTYEEV